MGVNRSIFFENIEMFIAQQQQIRYYMPKYNLFCLYLERFNLFEGYCQITLYS